MKKYIVQSYVNNDCSDYWEFENLDEAKQDFTERVRRIPNERRNENNQATIKFDDDDSWGYELYIEDDDNGVYETIDSSSRTWKEVKEGK